VNNLTDQQLLRDYVMRNSDTAFTELVRRHIDLVYSAALRMVCDAHLAEDVTQGAFVALAQNARQLADRPVLSGWLHRTAQNLAANAVRSDVRRRTREQEAAAMNELFSTESNAAWEHIAPNLDAALGELSEPDRDALLLRYFERKSAHEMAQTLGISDEAAQKRVSRAVEKLREFLSKQKITVGASGLAVLISASAVQAAPTGLTSAISTAVLAGTAATSTATITTKIIIMTTLQKTLIAAACIALAGTGIYGVFHLAKNHPSIARSKSSNSTDDYVPREDFAFAGYATPESTIKSLFWIQSKGDFKATMESASPRFRAILEQAVKAAPNGESTIVNSIVAESKNYLGYRITDAKNISDDKIVVSVLVDDARLKQIGAGDKGYNALMAKSQKQWQLIRVNSEWKYDGAPDSPRQ
jgi:RNA polymerase sigma factor (sigma-70 family)